MVLVLPHSIETPSNEFHFSCYNMGFQPQTELLRKGEVTKWGIGKVFLCVVCVDKNACICRKSVLLSLVIYQ